MTTTAPTLTDDDDADGDAMAARAKHLAACFAATLVEGATADEQMVEAASQLAAAGLHAELMRGWFRRAGMPEAMVEELSTMTADSARAIIAELTPKAAKLAEVREAAAAAAPSSIGGESPTERAKREKLEHQTATLARHLKRQVPPGTGFVLFVTDFGAVGHMAYASSCDRGDATRLVRDWLERMQ